MSIIQGRYRNHYYFADHVNASAIWLLRNDTVNHPRSQLAKFSVSFCENSMTKSDLPGGVQRERKRCLLGHTSDLTGASSVLLCLK